MLSYAPYPDSTPLTNEGAVAAQLLRDGTPLAGFTRLPKARVPTHLKAKP